MSKKYKMNPKNLMMLVLIIMIIFGAVYIMLDLDDDDLNPDISVTTASVDENSISYIIQNNGDQDLNNYLVNATQCNNGKGRLSDPISIPAGKGVKVTVYCGENAPVGTKVELTIERIRTPNDIQRTSTVIKKNGTETSGIIDLGEDSQQADMPDENEQEYEEDQEIDDYEERDDQQTDGQEEDESDDQESGDNNEVDTPDDAEDNSEDNPEDDRIHDDIEFNKEFPFGTSDLIIKDTGNVFVQDGDIYVVANDIDSNRISHIRLTRYDSKGNQQWQWRPVPYYVNASGRSDFDVSGLYTSISSIFVDDNNVYLAGNTEAPIIDFGNDVKLNWKPKSSNGWPDFFLLNLDKTGKPQWVAQPGLNTGNRSDKIYSIYGDGESIYAVGTTESIYIDFGNGFFRFSKRSGYRDETDEAPENMFLVKYTNGIASWISKENDIDRFEYNTESKQVYVQEDDVYLLGETSDSRNTAFGDVEYGCNGASDFLLKYTNQEPQWLICADFGKTPKGNGCNFKSFIVGDGIYIVGTTTGNMTIQGKNLIAKGRVDTFIAKFNIDGEIEWLEQIGGNQVPEPYVQGSVVLPKGIFMYDDWIYIYGISRTADVLNFGNDFQIEIGGEYFYAVYNTNGDFIAADELDYEINSVFVDDALYISGTAVAGTDFGNGHITEQEGSFIVRYVNE